MEIELELAIEVRIEKWWKLEVKVEVKTYLGYGRDCLCLSQSLHMRPGRLTTLMGESAMWSSKTIP